MKVITFSIKSQVLLNFGGLPMNKTNVLSKSEVYKLINEMNSTNDVSIKNKNLSKIVKCNQGLVYQIARKYKSQSKKDLDLDDIVSEGNIGLINGIRKFDTSLNLEFSTYITYTIQQKIRIFIKNNDLIRIPVGTWDKVHTFKKALMMFNNNEEKVKKFLNISDERFKKLSGFSNNLTTYSLDEPFSNNGESEGVYCLRDTITDGSQSPESDAIESITNQDILSLMKKNLTDKEQFILKNRVGLNTEKTAYTLEEIGNKLGVTRERIRQIEYKAKRKLRNKIMK